MSLGKLSKISEVHQLLHGKIYPGLNDGLFYLDIQYRGDPIINKFTYNLEEYGYRGYYLDPKVKNSTRNVIVEKIDVSTSLSDLLYLYKIPRFINFLHLDYLDNLMILNKFPLKNYKIGH